MPFSIIAIGILLFIGSAGGFLAGLVGVGGGIIVIPALVLFLGFSQQLAQGTSLAMMLPPIGILAVLTYYQQGHVDIKAAVFLCTGFLFGSIFGARLAVVLPSLWLSRIFGGFLVVVGVRLFFQK